MDDSIQETERQNGRFSCRSASLAFFFLTYLSLFKDQSAPVNNEAWAELATHPFISVLKSSSSFALAPFCLLAIVSVLGAKRLPILIFPQLFLLSLTLVIAALRGQAEDIDASYKTFGSCALFSLVAAYCCILLGSINATNYRHVLSDALLLSGLVLVWCNFFNFITGYGFVGHNPRLFGTAGHPNFLGAQLAPAGLIILGAFVSCRSIRWRAVLGISLVLALFLLLKTGSRTAVLMFLNGVFFYFWARAKFKLGTIVVLALSALVLSAIVFMSSPDVTGTSFDRGFGSGDTRSAALSELLDQVGSHPIWGRGYFLGASENSFLRGWAAYGLLYEITFLIFVVMALISAVRCVRLMGDQQGIAMFSALTFSLAAGGMLEGYLVDNFSYPLLLWFLSFTAYVMPRRSHRSARRPVTPAVPMNRATETTGA